MTDADVIPVHETALVDVHRRLGARLIDFAGWLMPVQYAGILDEHRAVRERAGLFDLSHMGELFVEGSAAGDALAAAVVSDPRTLAVGRAQYSMICAPDGGIIDDLIVYRLAAERFLVVANAGNAAVVSDELAARLHGWSAVLDDRSLATSLVAIQGPAAAGVLGPLTDVDLAGLRYYAIAEGAVAGIPALVARTGYTGEDGFEVFVDWNRRSGDLGGPRGRRPRRRRRPVRARGTRHAPARGRHAALRQRARPDHEPLRGRSGPRREAGQAGRLRRPGGPRARRARGHLASASSDSP